DGIRDRNVTGVQTCALPISEPLAHVTDREGPESCNTVNMLEAEQRLYEHAGGPWLFDAIERHLVGHVLSAQHPEGGFVYFTPAQIGRASGRENGQGRDRERE